MKARALIFVSSTCVLSACLDFDAAFAKRSAGVDSGVDSGVVADGGSVNDAGAVSDAGSADAGVGGDSGVQDGGGVPPSYGARFGWHWEHPFPTGNAIHVIWGSSENDFYVGGSGALLLHLQNGSVFEDFGGFLTPPVSPLDPDPAVTTTVFDSSTGQRWLLGAGFRPLILLPNGHLAPTNVDLVNAVAAVSNGSTIFVVRGDPNYDVVAVNLSTQTVGPAVTIGDGGWGARGIALTGDGGCVLSLVSTVNGNQSGVGRCDGSFITELMAGSADYPFVRTVFREADGGLGIGGLSLIFESADEGATWSPHPLGGGGQDIAAAFVTGAGETYVAGQSGVIWNLAVASVPELSDPDRARLWSFWEPTALHAVGEHGEFLTRTGITPGAYVWNDAYGPRLTLHAVASNASTAVAVGDRGLVLTRATDGRWGANTFASGANLYDLYLGASGSTSYYAGEDGLVRLSDHAQIGGNSTVYHVAARSDSDLYFTTQDQVWWVNSAGPSVVGPLLDGGEIIRALAVAGPSVWFTTTTEEVDGGVTSRVYQGRDGGTWSVAMTLPLTDVNTMVSMPPDDFLIAGENGFFGGSAAGVGAVPSAYQYVSFTKLWRMDDGGVFLSGADGLLIRWDGTAWIRERTGWDDPEEHSSAATLGGSGTDLFMVGRGSAVLHRAP